LSEELAAPEEADRLAEAVADLRARKLDGEPLARPWQCALAGQAAQWAVLSAALGAAPNGRAAALQESARAWARAELDAACSAAREGVREEAFLLAGAALDDAVAAVLAPAGDVELSLPGERWELDPLLRR
jgi:hypothetical protein